MNRNSLTLPALFLVSRMKTFVVIACLSAAAITHAQVGAKLPQLSIPKPIGESVFTNCVVTAVESDGVRITHDAGSAKIPYEHMPEAWKIATAAQMDEIKQQKAAREMEVARVAREAAIKEAKLKKVESFYVTVISVLKEGLIVDCLQASRPIADSSASLGGGGGVASGGYHRTGTILLLTGEYPKGIVDNDTFTVQAEADGTAQYQNVAGATKTVRKYNVLHHNKKE